MRCQDILVSKPSELVESNTCVTSSCQPSNMGMPVSESCCFCGGSPALSHALYGYSMQQCVRVPRANTNSLPLCADECSVMRSSQPQHAPLCLELLPSALVWRHTPCTPSSWLPGCTPWWSIPSGLEPAGPPCSSEPLAYPSAKPETCGTSPGECSTCGASGIAQWSA